MKNDTPEQPRVEPGIRRLPALLGGVRVAGGGSARGRSLVLLGLRGPKAREE